MAIVIIRQDEKIGVWKDELLRQAPELEIYSYLEAHPKDKITMALVWKHPPGSIMGYPNLKYIASSGAGVDFILADPSVPKGIPITRIIDPMLAKDMSAFVVSLIHNHLKNLSSYKNDQHAKQWLPKPYLRKPNVNVGVMGLGQLGTHLVKTLCDLGFQVNGWAASKKEISGVQTYVGQKERNEFLATTNVLVCLLPLTPQTIGVLNSSLFKVLPKGAFVINVARGGHLVDKDLISALDTNHLSGAALDVFHKEPLPENHPFWEHPNVHITPHVASVSDPASVVPQIIENFERCTQGKTLNNSVSVKKGY